MGPNIGDEENSQEGDRRNYPAERTQEENRMLPIDYLAELIIWKVELRCIARTSKKDKENKQTKKTTLGGEIIHINYYTSQLYPLRKNKITYS